MRVIKGTGDAKRMKGMVTPGVRTLRCPCGQQAQPVGTGAKNYHCNSCGRNFTASKM